MKLNAYGRKIEIVKMADNWIVYFLGNEGKKRTAHDIIIPSEIVNNEIIQYLEDILHEWATSSNNQIIVID